MADKPSKNILNEILYDPADDGAPDADQLAALIHRPPRQAPPARPQEETIQNEQATRGPKKRTTIYLSQTTFEDLAASKKLVREMLPENASGRVSMSAIVDNALRAMLHELATKRKDSVLFELMLRNMEKS